MVFQHLYDGFVPRLTLSLVIHEANNKNQGHRGNKENTGGIQYFFPSLFLCRFLKQKPCLLEGFSREVFTLTMNLYISSSLKHPLHKILVFSVIIYAFFQSSFFEFFLWLARSLVKYVVILQIFFSMTFKKLSMKLSFSFHMQTYIQTFCASFSLL